MFTKTILVVLSSAWLSASIPECSFAVEPPKREAVEHLAREYAFAERPKLNPTTTFRVAKFEIDGLWDAVRCEIHSVALLSADGTQFSSFCALYHDGTLTPIFKDVGGHGLMSATMHKGTLYGSYSWGSGLHRSHLVALDIADGKPRLRETGGFEAKDLFVSVAKDGTLAVQSGGFQAFNKWKDGKTFGILSIEEKELRVIDATGKNVAPEVPLRTGSDAKR